MLEDNGQGIYRDLKQVVDIPNIESIQDLNLNEIEDKIRTWMKQLIIWQQYVSDWDKESTVKSKLLGLDDRFIEMRKRQSAAYKKVINLFNEGRHDKGKMLLNIEDNYHPQAHEIVTIMLSKISEQRDHEQAIFTRFLISTIFVVVSTLVVLIILSIYSFGSITKNLKLLAHGADKISTGNFNETVTVGGPSEFVELAHSFNEMQKAILNRDKEIQNRTLEIKTLNEELEQRVIDRNKKIEHQNQVLSQKNKELEQILYTASHDLRTPLISIQGFSEELKYTCDTLLNDIESIKNDQFDNVREQLKTDIPMSVNYIKTGAKRIEILLDGLLRITRLGRESLTLEDVDLKSLLNNVCDGLIFQTQEAKAKISMNATGTIHADASFIDQVFSNLIGNAIKYRDPNRACTIDIRSETKNGISIICFKDNGIGISSENLDKVFNAFYRADEDKVNGEGLGLAIVSRILEMHNGKINIESKLGEGSKFIVELPNKLS